MAGSPTTRQMRPVGRRRRDAEENVEHQLEEARHKNESHGEIDHADSRAQDSS
jgi:hypothetical protein